MKIFSFTKKTSPLFEQVIPILMTLVVFAILATALFFAINILNLLPTGNPISLNWRWKDIIIGATIYFKTSVDFALFIGRLMQSNQGWRKRIAIEIGTALGNAVSTMIVLCLWVIFKELHILLGLMTLLAALILFEMADEGLSHFGHWRFAREPQRSLYIIIRGFLDAVLKVVRPLTSRIVPNLSEKLGGDEHLKWKQLFIFSLTIPFLLGLDDFAGYVPLFSIVNVFGFALGVLAAHMLLNIALFIKPEATIKFVKNQWISLLGSLAFIGLAIWGIIEAIRIFI